MMRTSKCQGAGGAGDWTVALTLAGSGVFLCLIRGSGLPSAAATRVADLFRTVALLQTTPSGSGPASGFRTMFAESLCENISYTS